MITKELMEEYQIKNVWRVSKKDETMNVGFSSAYLGECVNWQWVVVIDKSVDESDVFVFNTRVSAMKRIRKEGYWTRVSKVSI